MPTIVFDKTATTNPKFGGDPSNRTLEELLDSGIFLISKPRGPTSHQLAAWVRQMLGLNRLGHGGTLDPMATGLLTLLCGRATRLTDIILSGEKSYVAVLRFGRDVSDEELSNLLENLQGEIYNVPPKESAVKVQVRTRVINSLKLLDSEESSRIAVVGIDCVAGTYIRTLARDIGLFLDTKTELMELHRNNTGAFDESMSCSMQDLADAVFLWKEHDDESSLKKLIAPVEAVLTKLPSITIKDGAVAAMTHGAPLARPGLVSAPAGLESGTTVVVRSLKGEAVAIANLSVGTDTFSEMTSGEVAVAKNVLMPAGQYGQTWSKQN